MVICLANVRFAPQKDWAANNPAELAKVLKSLEDIQQGFNGAQSGGKKVSLADVIVSGGAAAIEQAAKQGGQRQVDGSPRRSGVWFKFRAARGRGILCDQRRK